MWRRPSFVFGLVALVSSLASAQAEYPPAVWVPADPGNYTVANRPTTYPINVIVIHVTQGSYASSIAWFQNPASNVSAHYIFRSSDGAVTQMVAHKNVGYHAGNWDYNTRSIGIEHEGFVADPSWFTAAMYNASADLVFWATSRHNIPRDRSHIIGHVEVPGATHTDPGPNWNWAYYMERINTRGTAGAHDFPLSIPPGGQVDVIVRMINGGDLGWANFGSGQVRLATQNPAGRSSPFFTSGNWISASRPAAPFTATTAVGATAEFRFRLTAPATPGTYNETFQLHKDSIGYFGPTLTFPIVVPNIERVYDNDNPNVEYKGTWSTGVSAPGHFGADYRFANTAVPATASATWNVEGVPDREYNVYAWWSQGTNRSTSAKFVLNGMGGLKPTVATVNQQLNGGQWNLLGRMRMGRWGGQVTLLSEGQENAVAIADAVKLVPVSLR